MHLKCNSLTFLLVLFYMNIIQSNIANFSFNVPHFLNKLCMKVNCYFKLVTPYTKFEMIGYNHKYNHAIINSVKICWFDTKGKLQSIHIHIFHNWTNNKKKTFKKEELDSFISCLFLLLLFFFERDTQITFFVIFAFTHLCIQISTLPIIDRCVLVDVFGPPLKLKKKLLLLCYMTQTSGGVRYTFDHKETFSNILKLEICSLLFKKIK